MNWKVYEHIGNPKKKTDFGLWAQKPSLRGATHHFSTTVKLPIPEKRKALILDVISSQAKFCWEVFFVKICV